MLISLTNKHLVRGRSVRFRGVPTCMLRWAGAPLEKIKFSAKFLVKSRPHGLKIFVCTPWKFSTAPLGKKIE
ncbi:hypothetical protein Hanom_Chr05g00465081 [Helianthus anomalus]